MNNRVVVLYLVRVRDIVPEQKVTLVFALDATNANACVHLTQRQQTSNPGGPLSGALVLDSLLRMALWMVFQPLRCSNADMESTAIKLASTACRSYRRTSSMAETSSSPRTARMPQDCSHPGTRASSCCRSTPHPFAIAMPRMFYLRSRPPCIAQRSHSPFPSSHPPSPKHCPSTLTRFQLLRFQTVDLRSFVTFPLILLRTHCPLQR